MSERTEIVRKGTIVNGEAVRAVALAILLVGR